VEEEGRRLRRDSCELEEEEGEEEEGAYAGGSVIAVVNIFFFPLFLSMLPGVGQRVASVGSRGGVAGNDT